MNNVRLKLKEATPIGRYERYDSSYLLKSQLLLINTLITRDLLRHAGRKTQRSFMAVSRS